MTDHCSRRWFQLSLKSLFLLTLVVAAFFAGYSLATRQLQEAMQAEQAARQHAEEVARQAEAEAGRLQVERDLAVIDLAVATRLNEAAKTLTEARRAAPDVDREMHLTPAEAHLPLRPPANGK